MKTGFIVFIIIVIIVLIIVWYKKNGEKNKDTSIFNKPNPSTDPFAGLKPSQGPGFYDSEGLFYGGALPSSAVESENGLYTIQNGIIIKYFS